MFTEGGSGKNGSSVAVSIAPSSRNNEAKNYYKTSET